MKILSALSCAILAGLAPSAIGQSNTPVPATNTAASSPPSAERLVERAGRVTDTRTGLVWARSDNRLDTTWPQAVSYCRRKGAGWRLPAVSELQSLHDVTQSVACGAWKCQVSPKFQLSGPWFWSNERRAVSDAAFVNLTSGASNGTHVGNRNGLQALCVRPA